MLSKFYATLKANFNMSMTNPIVFALLSLIAGMYGPRLASNLPPVVFNIVRNIFFRSFIALIIVYLTTKNIVVALAVAVVFCLYSGYIDRVEIQELFNTCSGDHEPNTTSDAKSVEDTKAESVVQEEGEEREAVSDTEDVAGYTPHILNNVQELDASEVLKPCASDYEKVISRTDTETSLRFQESSNEVCKEDEKVVEEEDYYYDEDMPQSNLEDYSPQDRKNYGFLNEVSNYITEEIHKYKGQ